MLARPASRIPPAREHAARDESEGALETSDAPSSPGWSFTGSLNIGRAFHTATLLPNGKVLAAGGDSLGSAELYDPNTGTWSITGSLNTPRGFDHTATLLLNVSST